MLKSLLVEQLADLYSAERQLLKAIPEMAEAANAPDLREALMKHLKQTEKQVERLTSVFASLGAQPEAKPCKGMAGLIEEGKDVIAEGQGKHKPEADLALIGAAQGVKHYHIAAYGTVRTIAENGRRRCSSLTRRHSGGRRRN